MGHLRVEVVMGDEVSKVSSGEHASLLDFMTGQT